MNNPAHFFKINYLFIKQAFGKGKILTPAPMFLVLINGVISVVCFMQYATLAVAADYLISG